MSTPKAPPPRLVFVNLAQDYGPSLPFSQLAAALAGQEGNPAVRAVMQVLRLQLGLAREHERMPAQSRDYAAGAAASADTSLEMLHHLMHRNFEHSILADLRQNFPDPKLKTPPKEG